MYIEFPRRLGMKPKISVIVPIYNVEKYLRHCINSIVNQSFKDIEVILVNDGSPDKCGEICDEYASNDSRIKTVHKPNGGLSDARNAGMEIANGEYICFIDSDDWIDTMMLEHLFSSLTSQSVDISVCGFCTQYENNNFSISTSLKNNSMFKGTKEIEEAIFQLDSIGAFNIVWNKLYSLKIIKNNQISFKKDGVPGEDLLFNCEYFKYINSVSFVNEELYYYIRRDEDTLVAKYRGNQYQQVKRFNKARKELYDFYNMKSEKCERCYAKEYVANIFSCVPNMYRKNSNLTNKQKIEFFHEIFMSEDLERYSSLLRVKSFHYSIFKVILNIGSPRFSNIFYSSLFFFRNNFEKLYRIFRKNIVIMR